jgi:hypothetical protein
MSDVSARVQHARDEAVAALVRAGTLCIELLDGSTPEKQAETDRALEDARFKGIVLNELLLEEGA